MEISIGFEMARGLFSGDMERAAREIKAAGFDGVDIAFYESPLEQVETKQWAAEVQQESEIIRNAGLEISQSHLHYQPSHEQLGDGNYDVFEHVFFPVWLREIQMCDKIGCRTTVAHLYFCDDPQKTIDGNMRLLEKLLPELQRHNVTLAIENIYGWGEQYADCGTTTAAQIMKYIDAFKSEYIGACLDSGHAVCTGNDPLQMARDFGRNLRVVHINSSSGRDTHLLPGMLPSWIDPTDFYNLSNELKKVGFAGAYNLEVFPGNFPSEPEIGQAYLTLAARLAKRFC